MHPDHRCPAQAEHWISGSLVSTSALGTPAVPVQVLVLTLEQSSSLSRKSCTAMESVRSAFSLNSSDRQMELLEQQADLADCLAVQLLQLGECSCSSASLTR